MSEPTNPCPDPAEPSGDCSHTWNLGPVVPPNEQAQLRAHTDAAVHREIRRRHLVGHFVAPYSFHSSPGASKTTYLMLTTLLSGSR